MHSNLILLIAGVVSIFPGAGSAQSYFSTLPECKDKLQEYKSSYAKTIEEQYACLGGLPNQKKDCSGLSDPARTAEFWELSRKRDNLNSEIIRLTKVCERMATGRSYDPWDAPKRPASTRSTYNNIQDGAEKLHKPVQKTQSSIVSKVQDRAWKKIRNRNQETLDEADEVTEKIRRPSTDSGKSF